MPRSSSSLPFDFDPRTVSSVSVEVPHEARPATPSALTVGELGRAIKRSLEVSFEVPVWVEGEVTGARPAASGHLYFCFKDEREDASIDVAIYKTNLTPRVRALVKDGARIRLRGKATFWVPRGRLQFVGERVEPVGRGALLEALERLKTKLAQEGLFEVARKRPLPAEPRIIGVVTSKTGAVIHDICKVAFRRGGARILLAPALVQGSGAAAAILNALNTLARVQGVDVIILGRGGGSSDDLSAFNDEALVRAIAAAPVPVISAVGHEVDVTLTDFVADARAATPSQAAEMVVPDARARREALSHCRARLVRGMTARVGEGARALGNVQRRLGDPRLALAAFQQSLDDRVVRLEAATRRPLARRSERLTSLERRLGKLHPSVRLGRAAKALMSLDGRLSVRMRALIDAHQRNARQLVAALDAMSPLKVLGRGYAIATTSEGRAVRTTEDVAVGDALEIRVAEGRFRTEVTALLPAPAVLRGEAIEPARGRRARS